MPHQNSVSDCSSDEDGGLVIEEEEEEELPSHGEPFDEEEEEDDHDANFVPDVSVLCVALSTVPDHVISHDPCIARVWRSCDSLPHPPTGRVPRP